MGTSEDVTFQRPKYVDRGHPQDVGRGRYIEDHMGTSIVHLLGTSSGRRRDVVLPSGVLVLLMRGELSHYIFILIFGLYNRFISPLAKKVRS